MSTGGETHVLRTSSGSGPIRNGSRGNVHTITIKEDDGETLKIADIVQLVKAQGVQFRWGDVEYYKGPLKIEWEQRQSADRSASMFGRQHDAHVDAFRGEQFFRDVKANEPLRAHEPPAHYEPSEYAPVFSMPCFDWMDKETKFQIKNSIMAGLDSVEDRYCEVW